MSTTKKPKRKPAAARAVEKKLGRPTAYLPEYDEMAFKLCLLGATDVEVADFVGVSEATVNAWKLAHPSFLESLKRGKSDADANVAHSLYRRALGYSHEAVKILTVADGNNLGSHIEEVPYTEHYPPETTAAIFWLKNRQGAKWRDKQTVEHDVTDALADRLAAARKRAAVE